jgi:hypothetical protein
MLVKVQDVFAGFPKRFRVVAIAIGVIAFIMTGLHHIFELISKTPPAF